MVCGRQLLEMQAEAISVSPCDWRRKIGVLRKREAQKNKGLFRPKSIIPTPSLFNEKHVGVVCSEL